MNLSERLNSLASVATGASRAMFESATAAYHAIFESEDAELAELSELGDEIGDSLDAEEGEGNDEGAPTGDEGDETAPIEDGEEAPAEENQAPAPEEPAPEQQPEDINAKSQPASVSADALIKELTDLKYPEKIRVVAQQMKQSTKGKAPTANDMIKPVAQAIAKYMAKKGYAAMQKDEAIRVVKTIIMAATDIKKPTPETKNAAD